MSVGSLIPDSNRLEMAFAVRGVEKTNLLHEAYSRGFVGAFSDDDEFPSWARRAARYLQDEFMQDTPGRVKLFNDVAPGLAAGDGECHINCRHAQELWEKGGRKGVKPHTCNQNYGSCVDASATEHTTDLLAWRVAKGGFPEEYRHAVAWYWYAGRGYCSDGWSGSGVAAQARRHGVAFRLQYQIGSNAVDFTDDDQNEQIVARQWCRSGIPSWLHDHTIANHAFEDGAITAFNDGGKAELKKAFAAGGVIHHSGVRTSGGSKPFTIGSTGPHMQSAVGYDDSDEFRKFCKDVIGVPPRDDDFPVVSHQTWGPGWRGECADQYWPPWWGPKPEGAWVWWASDMLNRISLDYVWLPWVKGFPSSGPVVPTPGPSLIANGRLFAEQYEPGKIAIRGEQVITIPAGLPAGDYKLVIVPAGDGTYKPVPNQTL